jgi:serine/threonine-protein kinase
LGKALAKDPNDRFERCADFARALTHRLDAAPTGDVGGTSFAPAAPPPKRPLLRAGVIVPAILALLLVAAIAVAVTEFRRADRPESPTAMASSPTVTSPTFTPLPPPPEPVQPPTTTPPAAPVAVIGARCAQVGSTATTADGATAYCSTLQTTGVTIWSLNPGDVPSPTVTAAPTDEPLPIEEESPVRVCMQQTGRNRLQCREEIRRSNLGLP